jgi:hypothetical protein
MTLREYLKSIADAIRSKLNLADWEKINAQQFLEAFDWVYERGHGEGQEKGREEGYNEGFGMGKEEGYNEGETDGYNRGVDEGYQNGYAGGYEQGELAGRTDGYNNGYSEGYANASRATEEHFWRCIQDNGKRTDYNHAFAYWGNIDFRPTYPIRPTNAGYMFMLAKIRRFQDGTTFDFSQATQMNYLCSSAQIEEFPYIISTVSASDLSALFGWNSAIRLIGTIILKDDGSQKLSYMFDNCYALENVTFSGKFGQNISFAQSTKLDRESIESIVGALLETASGKTLTLSRTAVNNAFDGGSTGNEWLNLVATKSNWTITLS